VTQQSVHGEYMGSPWTAKTKVAPSLDGGFEVVGLTWAGTSKGDVFYSGVGVGTESWEEEVKIYCNGPKWTAESNAQPVAAYFVNSTGSSNTSAVFWQGKSDNSIWYTYYQTSACGLLDWVQQATVGGSSWSASTDYAPAVASYPDYASVSILAWENAEDYTIWYIDPTTLPGLTPFAEARPDKP
jgi:hypothetical protein